MVSATNKWQLGWGIVDKKGYLVTNDVFGVQKYAKSYLGDYKNAYKVCRVKISVVK